MNDYSSYQGVYYVKKENDASFCLEIANSTEVVKNGKKKIVEWGGHWTEAME